MQNGKGMIKKTDFDNLKTYCTQNNNLDKELLKSITGMQAGKGMIKKADLDDMKKDNTMFDNLDGYFGNPDSDSKIIEDFLK